MNKRFFLILLTTITFSNFFYAQSYSKLNNSDTLSIFSNIFQSERKIIITKSKQSDKAKTEVNCIIYLDADDNNINGIILQSANNLISYNEIPQSYLIGIIQEDRNKELVEKEKLLEFITNEIIPMIEKKYSVSLKITIAGHSFGAYFATYAFLERNDIYNSCIAISPAYWPNNEDVLKLMNEKIKSATGNFYLSIGNKRWDEISLRNYVFKAKQILSNSKTIRFKFQDLDGFSHNATSSVGFGLGLSFIYDEWEWGNILEEQNRRLKSDPDFWGHLEIKGDALYHMKRLSEAKIVYQEALNKTPKDKDLSKKEIMEITSRLNEKIKNCR